MLREGMSKDHAKRSSSSHSGAQLLRTVSLFLLDRLRKRKKSTAGFIVGLIGESQVWAAAL